MKKIITMMLLASASYQLDAISSVMNHRLTTSSPLLYKVMDYSEKQLSIEFEPWVGGMFNPEHTMANLTPNGQSSLVLDQQGNGDVNPEWILLASNNETIGDYQSTVNFNPELSMYGVLFHCYKQFEYFYFDVKTALIECKTNIELTESGGGNGGLSNLQFPNMNDETVYNAQDAFTQPDWNYGKIGQSNRLIGFDNIQVTFGSTKEMNSFSTPLTRSFISGFALVEVPTGAGTTAEWLFEPQVGTNHWAFGFGADVLVASENGFSLTAGANFRHFIANWEKRSFDLTNNGAWSRYLGTDLVTSVDIPTVGTPGINLFTQDALIQGRNQITMYTRLQKKFSGCLLELSYNYMHQEAETISKVTSIAQGYGIFDMSSGLGGDAITASSAKINQGIEDVVADLNSVELVTSDLNLASGAMSAWNSNMITARLQRVQENYTYGIGASADLAHSAQALSSWSVWANFEILLP